MQITYDGTFDGLLTVMFALYAQRLGPDSIGIKGEPPQLPLFGAPYYVETQAEHARRVAQGLDRRHPALRSWFYRCWLTEVPGVEMLIVRVMKRAFDSADNVMEDYGDPEVLRLQQLHKQLGREEHRMHAFVRFAETKSGLFAATIRPDFNVLPLLSEHFVPRYPAFDWLIYDAGRRYGLLYQERQTRFVALNEEPGLDASEPWAEDEAAYQGLWRTYFDSVNIAERRNDKLHLQHVPRRYWAYLTEKRR